MRRRNFIAALAGVAMLRPTATSAQGPQRNVPLIGVVWLGTASDQISVRIKQAFLRGLRENGYIEGQNITIEHRYSEVGPDQLNNTVDELVQLGVDVIVATGTPAALAAKRATNSIPIVALSMADPVADGLIASLARPGGNVTGNTFMARIGPQAPSIAQRGAS